MTNNMHTAQGEGYYEQPVAHSRTQVERWQELFAKNNGDKSKIIKEAKLLLRRASPLMKRQAREDLKFAKEQSRLLKKPY